MWQHSLGVQLPPRFRSNLFLGTIWKGKQRGRGDWVQNKSDITKVPSSLICRIEGGLGRVGFWNIRQKSM